MFLKPRSGQPTKMPFIAGAIVVAATIAALGLTQGDSVATVLARPLSALAATDAPSAAPSACHHACMLPPQHVYLKPSQAETRTMEKIILAQIAAVRKNDQPAVCRYVSSVAGTSFASDPTTSLQRLRLLATANRLAFDGVEIGPCHHDGYVTVIGYFGSRPMYTATYTLATADAKHPAWGVSSIDVALFAPAAPSVAKAHGVLPDTAKS